jgi:hypothetical protein
LNRRKKALYAFLFPLQLVVETVFAGTLEPAELSWAAEIDAEKAKTPVGDVRDWTAIAA